MTTASSPRRVIVGITGATGAIFGVRTLQQLRALGVETHLVVTTWGARTLEHETPYSVSDLKSMADVVHKAGDQGATVSSGSFPTDGMIIAPCSVKTLSSIANGYAADLVSRAADVVLKERRRLVLLVREAPLSEIHLENMLRLARMGASIVPPVPAFYNRPESLDEVVDYIVARALDQLGVHADTGRRWDGNMQRPAPGGSTEQK